MATLKSLADIKNILKAPRISMIEVMRQVNSKNETRYFALINNARHKVSKELYEELDSLAERKDTFYTKESRNCFNHYKTLKLFA